MDACNLPHLEPRESVRHQRLSGREHIRNRKEITAAKRVKQWWFMAVNGKLIINVRYGTRLIELAKGKTAVEVASKADLVPTLELIKQAVEAGELDAQIAAASEKLLEGFGK